MVWNLATWKSKLKCRNLRFFGLVRKLSSNDQNESYSFLRRGVDNGDDKKHNSITPILIIEVRKPL
jgi:hypothetical protein